MRSVTGAGQPDTSPPSGLQWSGWVDSDRERFPGNRGRGWVGSRGGPRIERRTESDGRGSPFSHPKLAISFSPGPAVLSILVLRWIPRHDDKASIRILYGQLDQPGWDAWRAAEVPQHCDRIDESGPRAVLPKSRAELEIVQRAGRQALARRTARL